MLKTPKAALLGLTAVAAFPFCSNAALTYWVDTAKQHIIFNGTWEGGSPTLYAGEDPVYPAGSSYVSWEVVNSDAEYVNSTASPLSGSLHDSEGVTSNSLIFFAAGGPQNSGSGNNINLLFDIIFTEHSGAPSTLTIDNLTFSYNHFRADMKAYINQLPNSQPSMELGHGTGYGDIAYAVPEASHAALALGCAAAALLIRRRVRKTAQSSR